MYTTQSSSSDISALIEAINNFPQEWALTPCVDKKNLWPAWNTSKLDRAQLIEAIRSRTNHEGKKTSWTGVSIVTGPLSGGGMAIDFDGPLALQKYLDLSDGQMPPTTMRWTSGKPGHFQILLSVSPEKWEKLKAVKFFILRSEPRIKLGLSESEVATQLETTEKNISLWESGSQSPVPPQLVKKLAEIYGVPDGKLVEKLEFRWNECSTLPPSIHPDTGEPYFWENQGAIAECPNFMLDLMREASVIELLQKPKLENPISTNVDEKSLVDILESEILPRLDAEEFYGSYTKLKTSGKSLKGLCPLHDEKTGSFTIDPDTKLFKCFGCGAGGGPVQFLHQIKGGSGSPTGKEFAEVVRELAGKVGVQMPDRKFNKNSKPNNVIQHPTANNVVQPNDQISLGSALGEAIEHLLESNLRKSQLQLKISELALSFRINSADLWKIYREREQELEQESYQEDTAAEVARLLSTQKAGLELAEILPPGLAAPIKKLAGWLNLRHECFLAALLGQVSSLYKVETETLLRRDTDYRCTPNYFIFNVSESSNKKTLIKKAMIDRPMQGLREKARKEYQKAVAEYEEEYRQWKAAGKDKGLPPKEPRQRLYSFSKTTGEGILYQVAAFPSQALMYSCDELAGLFKSANQYRGGKGSDEEDLLEFWNGTGSTVLRASGTKADVDGLLLSIFGTIQPDVLAELLKDCSDSNGKFARFDFVFQPLAASKLSEEDSGSFDITPMLAELYTAIDKLPVMKFELSPDAKRLFTAFYNATEERRVNEPKQGMRAMMGKMPEKVGKMATIIHTIHCAFTGAEVSLQIPKSAVEAAIKFVKFSADQIASLYAEFSDRQALAPNLAKIVLLAERKGGTLTVRDCQKSFDSKKRPNAEQVKSWFRDLALMNYGAVVDSNKTSSFVVTIPTVTNTEKDIPQLESLHSKGSRDNWGNTGGTDLPQLESLRSKGSEPSVTNCHYILQTSGIQALKQPEFIKDEKPLFPHSPTVTVSLNTDTVRIDDLPQCEKAPPPVVTDSDTQPIAPPEPQTTQTAPQIDTATGLNESGLKIGDWFEGVGTRAGIKGEIINVLPNGDLAVEFYSPAENAKLRRVFAAKELRKAEPESGGVAPGIAPADAEKMREIALVGWPEYYPEHLQSLVTQMFGWGAPARKYSTVQIAQWVQGEDELVKHRIAELMVIGLADEYEEDEEEE